MAEAAVWNPIIPGAGGAVGTPQHRPIKLGGTPPANPPTLAQVNALTDWQQVFAMYNRRASQMYENPVYQTLHTNQFGCPTAASINSLRAAVGAMYTDFVEGIGINGGAFLSSFNFGTDLATGMVIKASHLTDLRAAIDATNSGKSTFNYIFPFFINPQPGLCRQYFLRNTPAIGTIYLFNAITGVGEVNTGGNFDGRVGMSIPCSQPFKSSSSTQLVVTDSYIPTTGTLALFRSNQDDHLYTGTWYNNGNNFVDSVSVVSSLSANVSFNINIPDSFRAPVNGFISFLFVDWRTYYLLTGFAQGMADPGTFQGGLIIGKPPSTAQMALVTDFGY